MALTAEQQALDYNPELQDISRQRKIADLLMAKGLEQPQGQMISGRYVAPSWSQHLQSLGNAAIGTGLSSSLDEKQLALSQALRGKGQEEVTAILDLAKTDPNAALKMATTAQTPQAKGLAAQLSKVALVEPTTLEREWKAAQSDPNNPFKGSLNDFKNQMNEYQKAELKNSQARLAIEQAKANQEKVNPQEAGLRSSFLNQAQPHIQISQAYRKIESAPDTAAGDMSKIFGFMKILDPGSTVREGEYASAENARGVPDTVKAQYNKVISGQRLSPAQRTQFTQAAGDLINSQKQQFGEVAKYYSDISKRYQINPENIVYDPYKDLNVQTTPPKAPKPQINAAQQLGVPQANNGWNIINVTPSR